MMHMMFAICNGVTPSSPCPIPREKMVEAFHLVSNRKSGRNNLL